jgi:hypothetical protein
LKPGDIVVPSLEGVRIGLDPGTVGKFLWRAETASGLAYWAILVEFEDGQNWYHESYWISRA